jgi:hypothetical protein
MMIIMSFHLLLLLLLLLLLPGLVADFAGASDVPWQREQMHFHLQQS